MSEFKTLIQFDHITKDDFALVGGKGYNLGILSKEGFPVPKGFCITTSAFINYIKSLSDNTLFAQLETLDCSDIEKVRILGEKIRTFICKGDIDNTLAQKIKSKISDFGEDNYYAVRSSATAEDLPTMSFAGQQDTYLNIKGTSEILKHIKHCWASLYTDRAIMYRGKNNIPHGDVHMCVVVQKMIVPVVSGIMFTADPLTENRNIISIDSSYGLGEALVSGLVTPDTFKYSKKSKTIISKDLCEKKQEIIPLEDGGTSLKWVDQKRKSNQSLNNDNIIKLAEMGENIENVYGTPQDIEWALDKSGEIFITQSRAITSLFPRLQANVEDGDYRAYISFNHVQVMMNSFKPLGTSFIKMLFPLFKEKGNPLSDSGMIKETAGRIFVDLTPLLSSSKACKMVPKALENVDTQMAESLREILSRDEFKNRKVTDKVNPLKTAGIAAKLGSRGVKNFFSKNTNKVDKAYSLISSYISSFEEEMKSCDTSLDRLYIMRKYISGYLNTAFSNILPMIIPGIISYKTLVKLCHEQLGSDELAQKLPQGLLGNVTTEMGLEIGDIAELFRDNPHLMSILKDNDKSEVINKVMESAEEPASSIFKDFMERNDSRGIGEIDITSERWFEDSTALVQSIENHLQVNENNEHRRKYDKLVQEAQSAGEEIVQALGTNPIKKLYIKQLVNNVRNLMPVREHPKYGIIRCFGICKRYLLNEGSKLSSEKLLDDKHDVYFLSLREIEDCVENKTDCREVVKKRKAHYNQYKDVTPPRVITSEGEIIRASSKRIDIPDGSLGGNPVSAGIIEGTAKVVLDPTDAVLKKGEILIAPFTDPGWTPLFVNAQGLVLEVGGLLTHGAVVAREYGIPAVVGVNDATKLIKTGDKIRVDGSKGYIEIL